MSEVVVRMEMPKHGCCDCMVELMGLCVIQDKDVPLKNENGDYPTELPKGCPIIGVLPEQHGRLVDASTVLFEADDSEGVAPPMPVTVDDYLLLFDLPTIVPATERRTDDLH